MIEGVELFKICWQNLTSFEENLSKPKECITWIVIMDHGEGMNREGI